MRAIGFTWLTDTRVETDEHKLDLHEDYMFRQLSYDVARRSLNLNFVLRNSEAVYEGIPARCVISVSEVTSLEISPRDPVMPFNEDDCFSGLAFLADEEWCTEPFWRDGAPEDQWSWVFDFMSDMQIIVDGETASLIVR
jgi:hypothetical protein